MTEFNRISQLKENVADIIDEKLKGELTCDDVLKLAQAAVELDKSDVFSAMTKAAVVGFGNFIATTSSNNASDTLTAQLASVEVGK